MISMSMTWPLIKLGEVICLEYGKPLPKEDRSPEGAYPVYGANGEKARSNKFYHSTPTIIVGRKGSAGQLNLTEGKFWPLDVTFFVTFDEDKYDLKFLYYLLQNLNLPDMAKGVKPGINRNDVYAIEVRIPPKNVQQRIASILDEVIEHISLSEIKWCKIDFLELALSIISHYHDGTDSQTKTLGSVVSVISGSGFPKKFQGHQNQPIPFLKVSDMNLAGNEVYITKSNHTISRDTMTLLKAKLIPSGSVIFPKIGGAILTNKKRILTKPSCIDNNVVALVPSEKILSKFLYHTMLKTDLYQLSNKAALPSIKSSTLKEHVISVPPITKQNWLAETVETSLSLVDELEKCSFSALASLNELKKSIFMEAFNGKLTEETIV